MQISPAGFPAVAVLYPGEMGAALAQVLAAQGYPLLTTLAGRSGRTAELCRTTNIAIHPSLASAVQEADIVLSVVTPAAAADLAKEVCHAAVGRSRPLVYLEANSISPQTMERIGEIFADSCVEVVDVTVHGRAANLSEKGTIYTSGPAAGVVDLLFGSVLRVKQLGTAIGRASLQKMLLGAMSKGIVALFLQTSLLAHKADVVDEFLEELQTWYPDVFGLIRRILPTCPRHAERRSQEMHELEQTMASHGLDPAGAAQVRRLFTTLAESDLRQRSLTAGEPTDLRDLIDLIAADNPLKSNQDNPRPAAAIL